MSEFTKTAIVTGASRGIGKAIALRLAEAGMNVAVCARNEAILSTYNDSRIMPVIADVSDFNQVEELVNQVLEQFGRIDVVVNNAGITRDNLLMRMSNEEWEQVLQVNLTGTFYVCRAVIRQMLKQRYGRIVNIASVVGVAGNPGQANYAAAKAGIIGLTKSLAKEVASRQILVNAVAPGYIDTDMTQVLSEQQKQSIVNHIPLGRVGQVGDVAELVHYLVSDTNMYITGQVINVDGGLVI
ncbi:MAG TPA: 3-oxoacyl-[acyl-carrier-protein] reductase [Firmicutes bacterium]|nr:3-oxoacyl-[acyl-carrier-protein] reductase [Bacillota bacterium]